MTARHRRAQFLYRIAEKGYRCRAWRELRRVAAQELIDAIAATKAA